MKSTLLILLLSISMLSLKAQNRSSIYPNPFRDTLNFRIDSLKNNRVDIAIYNRWGEVLGHPVKDSLCSGTLQSYYVAEQIEMGTYFVAVKIDSLEENEIVLYSPTTHVSIKRKVEFNLYPNPVKTKLYLKANTEIIESIVYNSRGKEVARIKRDQELNLGHLKSGVYHLSIQTRNGFIHERILKE